MNRFLRRTWGKVVDAIQRRYLPGYHGAFMAEESMRQRCQAEDMGGWPACDEVATLQTKEVDRHGERRYYCEAHRINRHVWYPDIELEPIKDE